MENHHHCEDCGNMISPSKLICLSCETKRKNIKLKKEAEKRKKTYEESKRLSLEVEEAIEKYTKEFDKSPVPNKQSEHGK